MARLMILNPTAPPAWGNWPGWAEVRRDLLDRLNRRRVRLSLQDLRDLQLEVDWPRLARPKITVFKPDELRNLIRFDRTRQTYVFPTQPISVLRERYPNDPQLWHLPDFTLLQASPAPAGMGVDAGGRGGGGGAGGASRWEAAARGWAAGAVLLAVLVLLVRVAEKCLDKRLFKLGRRRSEEWPTPIVLATSHQHTNDELAFPRLDDSDTFPSEGNLSNDLPPPYSECANAGDNIRTNDPNKIIVTSEEPPPPYSACYVAFSNPKDGQPSVHFYNSHDSRLEIGHASDTDSRNIDDRDAVVTSNSMTVEGSNSVSRELVFDNGRVIERQVITDLDVDDTQSNVNTVSANDIETSVKIENATVIESRHFNGVLDRVQTTTSAQGRVFVV